MSKISTINPLHLRNDGHFQFHTEFRDLVSKAGAAELKILEQFDAYVRLYDRVDLALKKVTASALTAKIKEADKGRADMYSGMVAINTASLKHYAPNVREAAGKLKILFRTYGNISQKPINEQTSATYNILQELNGEYAETVSAVGIEGWVSELQNRNNEFDRLMKERDSESTGKVDIVLKNARAELDTSYRGIVERIGALVIVEGAAQYETFIKSLNTVIARYVKKINAAKARGKKSGRAAEVEDVGDDDGNE